MFTLHIDLDRLDGGLDALADALRDTAEQISGIDEQVWAREGSTTGPVRDNDGQKVGEWALPDVPSAFYTLVVKVRANAGADDIVERLNDSLDVIEVAEVHPERITGGEPAF